MYNVYTTVIIPHTGTVVSGEETDVIPEKDYDETQTPVTVPAGPSPPPTPISFRALHSLGLSDDLYRYHRDLSMESTRQMDPADPQHKAVPLPYCNAFLLDDAAQQKRRGRSSFGYPSATFQVTNREDGHLYCLKRFDNVRSVSPKIALAVSDRWSTARAVQEHPGIVPFYQCFVAQRAVFFVHQYIPGSRTLSERLLGPQQFGGAGHPLPETVLWSCIAQLVSVIRTIHGSNLAVRTIRLQHILSNQCIFDSDGGGNAATGSGSSGRLRLRLGSLGVVDTLEFEARKHVADLQMEDMRDLGRLILSLATATDVCAASTATDVCAETMNRCEQYLARNYSPELQSLTMTLIRRGPRPPSILEVSRAIASRICFEEQDAVYRALDRTERALSSEYESGRALRLLLKLGFVNERPELGPNRRWAQSGDCYMLTLFRDYGKATAATAAAIVVVGTVYDLFVCCTCHGTHVTMSNATARHRHSLSSSRRSRLSRHGFGSCRYGAQQTGRSR